MPNIALCFPVTVHRCESQHPIQHFPQNHLYVSCWTANPGTGVDSSLLLLVTIFSCPLSAAGPLTLAPVLTSPSGCHLFPSPLSCWTADPGTSVDSWSPGRHLFHPSQLLDR